MTNSTMRRTTLDTARGAVSRMVLASAGAMLAVTLLGCSALDVSNPTRVTIDNVANAVGADYTLAGVHRYFGFALGASVTNTGLVADEFFVNAGNTISTLSQQGALDRRESAAYELLAKNNEGALYPRWQTAWRYATIALSFMQQYGPPSTREVQLSELFALRGYVMLGLAEQICPGFPVRDVDAHDLNAIRPVYTSAPQTADSAFLRAAAQFDSALAHAGDSVRVLNLARVGKARALLGLGRFSEAGTVAATVPSGYTGGMVVSNTRVEFRSNGVAVSDSEGTNGKPFVAAADPRISLVPVQQDVDGVPTTMWYAPAYYYNNRYPIVTMASDIEARLIEAESQLQSASSPSGPWLETLNTLRRNIGLPDLTDPTTGPERIDLLFRERAFWLFATGHRLGDLRRLISRYGRSAEAVFPSGAYRSGNYGTATSIPFDGVVEHTYNAAITGCLAQ